MKDSEEQAGYRFRPFEPLLYVWCCRTGEERILRKRTIEPANKDQECSEPRQVFRKRGCGSRCTIKEWQDKGQRSERHYYANPVLLERLNLFQGVPL